MKKSVSETAEKVQQPIPYILIRRPGKKGVTIRITKAAEVEVIAPPSASYARIDSWVREKLPWIQKKCEHVRLLPPEIQHTWQEGDRFYLFGKEKALRIIETEKKQSSVTETEEELVVSLAANKRGGDACKSVVLTYFKTKLAEYIQSVSQRFASSLGIAPPPVSINLARKRWGSCSTNGAVRFSVRAVTLNTELIDYLILHEFAHILHFDHGKLFRETLTKIMPDWKQRQKQLYAFQAASNLN